MSKAFYAECKFGDLQEAKGTRVYKVRTFSSDTEKFKKLIEKTEYFNDFAIKEGLIAKIDQNYFYHKNECNLYSTYREIQGFLIRGEDSLEKIENYLKYLYNLYNDFVCVVNDSKYNKIAF